MITRMDELAERIGVLRLRADRVLIGIVGEPGAGKSTVSAAVLDILGGDGVVVPMDGFHLSRRELTRLGRADRRGAYDTFDGFGYLQLIKRLRAADEPVVYAPDYVRGVEEAIAGSIAVNASIPVFVTEGNYLLDVASPWDGLRQLFDETWYVQASQQVRVERLIRRHVRFGMAEARARAWASDVDEINARRVRSVRDRADLIIDMAALDVTGSQ